MCQDHCHMSLCQSSIELSEVVGQEDFFKWFLYIAYDNTSSIIQEFLIFYYYWIQL